MVELMLLLFLIAWTAAVGFPVGQSYHDRFAVVGAREAVAGLIAEARVVAVSSGSAHVYVDGESGRVWSEAELGTLRSIALDDEPGVMVSLSGGRLQAELSWDALGLGRFTSQTIEFRRGGARARLIVSSYGRVRRD